MRRAARLPPSHEVADHTSELWVRLRAASFGDLLAEAGRALAAIQLRGAVPGPPGKWRRLEVEGGDRAGLLAEWLNELIYLAETDRWIATEFEIERAAAGEVLARARGTVTDRAPGLVKAATLHGLRVKDVPGGVAADVVLDV